MTDIVVKRGAGDRPGPDIHATLLSSDPPAVARGRAEIDAGSPHDIVSLTCRYLGSARPGLLVEVRDVSHGAYWRAKIIGVRHVLRPARYETTLRLWRPLETLPA